MLVKLDGIILDVVENWIVLGGDYKRVILDMIILEEVEYRIVVSGGLRLDIFDRIIWDANEGRIIEDGVVLIFRRTWARINSLQISLLRQWCNYSTKLVVKYQVLFISILLVHRKLP